MQKKKFLKDKVVNIILTDKDFKDYILLLIHKVTNIPLATLQEDFELMSNRINLNVNPKYSYTDALYETRDYLLNIEVNTSKSQEVLNKNARYICWLILKKLSPSDKDKLKRVIQINLNEFDFYGKKELVYHNSMLEEKHSYYRDRLVKIIDVNVELLKKLDYTKINKGSLEYLLYVFVCEDKIIRKKLYEGDEMMEKVANKLDELMATFGVSYNYDEFHKKVAFEEGEMSGIKKGVKQGIMKTALNFLKSGLNPEFIAKNTGLSLAEVKKLEKNIK